MSRRFQLIGLAIFAFWAVMTALLFRREFFVPTAEPAARIPAGLRQPSDTWMGIYTSGPPEQQRRVGYVHLLSKPETRGGESGMDYAMVLRLATTMFSMPTELLLNGSAWVDDNEGLSEFKFHAQSFGDHVLEAEGKIEDDRLNVNVKTAGETFPVSFPIDKDVLLRANFGAATLNLPSLEIGDEVLIDAFDPVTMSKGTARIACVGMETVEYDGQEITTKILTTDLGGMTTRTWVTLDDEVMRVETPMGLTLKRISQREAMAELETEEVQEVIRGVAVRPAGAKPFSGAREMRVRITKIPEGATIPESAFQRRVAPNEYLIEMPDVPGEPNVPARLERLAEHLEGGPLIQVGHERMRRQVQAILGGEDESWPMAEMIYDWVYTNIEKVPLLSFPSALDVLESRRGDCNEHTVLYAALARTAGIPTRIAIGLVWSREYEAFYYHAWPEVYVGAWIPVDPTLGQPVADATHIKLLEGSIDQWPRLAPYLGQVEIEVLDVK